MSAQQQGKPTPRPANASWLACQLTVRALPCPQETITLASNKELRIARLAGQQHAPCSCVGAAGAGACASGTGAAAVHRCPQCGGEGSSSAPTVTWRLDRDEAASTFSQMRLNLAKLCINGAGMGWQKAGGGGGGRGGGGGGGGATQQPSQAADRRREAIVQRLRQLVVQLEAPQQGVTPGAGATMDSQAPCGSGEDARPASLLPSAGLRAMLAPDRPNWLYVHIVVHRFRC